MLRRSLKLHDKPLLLSFITAANVETWVKDMRQGGYSREELERMRTVQAGSDKYTVVRNTALMAFFAASDQMVRRLERVRDGSDRRRSDAAARADLTDR